jgi:hypothetical protein
VNPVDRTVRLASAPMTGRAMKRLGTIFVVLLAMPPTARGEGLKVDVNPPLNLPDLLSRHWENWTVSVPSASRTFGTLTVTLRGASPLAGRWYKPNLAPRSAMASDGVSAGRSLDRPELRSEESGTLPPNSFRRFACRVRIQISERDEELVHPGCRLFPPGRAVEEAVGLPLGGEHLGPEADLLRAPYELLALTHELVGGAEEQ